MSTTVQSAQSIKNIMLPTMREFLFDIGEVGDCFKETKKDIDSLLNEELSLMLFFKYVDFAYTQYLLAKTLLASAREYCDAISYTYGLISLKQMFALSELYNDLYNHNVGWLKAIDYSVTASYSMKKLSMVFETVEGILEEIYGVMSTAAMLYILSDDVKDKQDK